MNVAKMIVLAGVLCTLPMLASAKKEYVAEDTAVAKPARTTVCQPVSEPACQPACPALPSCSPCDLVSGAVGGAVSVVGGTVCVVGGAIGNVVSGVGNAVGGLFSCVTPAPCTPCD